MPSTRRTCTACGMPTNSVTGLCTDCRRAARAAKRPEAKCSGCGKPTTSKKNICRDCATPALPCAECGTRGAGVSGLCQGCASANRDSESPWALEEGYWRRVRGIQEWVPLLVEPDPEPEEVVEDPGVRECAYGGCGVWFVVRRWDHRYCTKRCSDSARQDRRAARAQEAA